jgi:glycosyltransferase involved in cell wall biosynthesis
MPRHVNEPTVTVLLPVYNGAAYLAKAIESVLAQTYDDFELLIIDDASRDDSVDVVRSFEDPRIRLLLNDANLGQVGTVNRGLDEARGRYVARLDQDDTSLPRRLELQVRMLDSEPEVAVAGGWVEVVDPDGRVVETLRGATAGLPELVAQILLHRVPIAHSAVMFRRDEVVALGGYDATYRLAEDQDLWRRLALERREARIVPEVVLRYLVHEGQQSAQSYGEQLENSMRSLDVFVAELSDRVPAEEMRRLFTAGEPRGIRHVDAFLEDASRRLALDGRGAGELEGLLRNHVYREALRSWRCGLRRFWLLAPPLVRFGVGDERPLQRVGHIAAFMLVYAGAPILELLRRARHGSGRAGR